MTTVSEVIQRLQEIPGDWQAYATKAGGSIEVWDQKGVRYAYVFTDDRETRYLTSRRREAELQREEPNNG